MALHNNGGCRALIFDGSIWYVVQYCGHEFILAYEYVSLGDKQPMPIVSLQIYLAEKYTALRMIRKI